jgi:hypothetical protein
LVPTKANFLTTRELCVDALQCAAAARDFA